MHAVSRLAFVGLLVEERGCLLAEQIAHTCRNTDMYKGGRRPLGPAGEGQEGRVDKSPDEQERAQDEERR